MSSAARYQFRTLAEPRESHSWVGSASARAEKVEFPSRDAPSDRAAESSHPPSGRVPANPNVALPSPPNSPSADLLDGVANVQAANANNAVPEDPEALDADFDQALSLVREQAREFAEAAVKLAAARKSFAIQAEEELLELAVEIAREIIGEAVESHAEIHRNFARAALAALLPGDSATLHVSRDAYSAIVDTFGTPAIEWEGTRINIAIDSTLDGIGCIAENSDSRVDATLAARLRNVREALVSEHHRRHAQGAGQ